MPGPRDDRDDRSPCVPEVRQGGGWARLGGALCGVGNWEWHMALPCYGEPTLRGMLCAGGAAPPDQLGTCDVLPFKKMLP